MKTVTIPTGSEEGKWGQKIAIFVLIRGHLRTVCFVNDVHNQKIAWICILVPKIITVTNVSTVMNVIMCIILRTVPIVATADFVLLVLAVRTVLAVPISLVSSTVFLMKNLKNLSMIREFVSYA